MSSTFDSAWNYINVKWQLWLCLADQDFCYREKEREARQEEEGRKGERKRGKKGRGRETRGKEQDLALDLN